MPSRQRFELATEWVGITHTETAQGQETYGYVEPNRVSLEGVRFLPKGRPSNTLIMYMHPTATISRLPVPRAMAEAGMHVLCAESRYTRNDTALIMEKVLLDFGAFVRHAKDNWGYEKVILAGWSGGGSLTAYYQSQAENPTVVDTPAGDPIDLGQLVVGDGVVFHAAHLSRADMLADFIDPSVIDEANPDIRNPELDLYDPRNPEKPPYSAEYLQHFRAEQKARVRRRTTYVKELLEQLRSRGGPEADRVILTQRTMADPRCLDPAIEPNDRKPGTSLMGDPAGANVNPAGIARYCTLRSWLSQWSFDDSRARADVAAGNITVPVLVIENSADHVVPQPHSGRFYSACASTDKTFFVAEGADHYYGDDNGMLDHVVDRTLSWMTSRNLLAD